jgi:hypothetical protein
MSSTGAALTFAKARREAKSGPAVRSENDERELHGSAQLWLQPHLEVDPAAEAPPELSEFFSTAEEWREFATKLDLAVDAEPLPCRGNSCLHATGLFASCFTLGILPWPCWCLCQKHQEERFRCEVNKVLMKWNEQHSGAEASLHDVSELFEHAYIAFEVKEADHIAEAKGIFNRDAMFATS